ncbi:glycosyl transferase [Maribacter sp. MMG018]|uniref:ATP-grasp fold amidoligase family protein n=1 Tax=Maribacter sp. MMG018 TaxID=2822688 RepID=UPI001B36E9D8|nr:ATP-grasp fold amidoligase family protein [Maribacter sp. MMG018]MBQ4915644.1 glycosyl transferase [Maribacter sp. MMG018]
MKKALQSLFVFILPLIPDKQLVQLKFRWHMGYFPNLKNPSTLNEKINWLKLYDRTPLHTQCSDKYLVREYIKEKIGNQFLVPLYFTTTNPKEITPENISDVPCIIKANHDSSGGIFVHDKSEINWEDVQETFKERLKLNYYVGSREWQYKNIEPRIIVEKLLQDKNGNIPFDYKLHCFNGKVRMISVDMGRGTDQHYRNWYNTNWEREEFKWSSPKGNGKSTDPSEEDAERPTTLNEMIRLSEILAEPFSYVRVDWYDVDGVLYFGELTFHHDGGFRPIEPKIWDKKLGNELKLPI